MQNIIGKENEVKYSSDINNGSYSTSSGVSSCQSSPLCSVTGSEFDQQKNLMELNNQVISTQGILEPIDELLVNVKNSTGKTPLLNLFEINNYDMRTTEQLKSSIDRLIQAGANVNAQDNGLLFINSFLLNLKNKKFIFFI